MSNVRYRLIFEGRVSKGEDRETVRKRIASLLKIDEEKSAALFSGKKVVLKDGADIEFAQKMQSAFRKAGAVLVFEEIPSSGRSRGADGPPSSGKATPPLRTRNIASNKKRDYSSLIVLGGVVLIVLLFAGYTVWLKFWSIGEGGLGAGNSVASHTVSESAGSGYSSSSASSGGPSDQPSGSSGSGGSEDAESSDDIHVVSVHIANDFVPVDMTLAAGGNSFVELYGSPVDVTLVEPAYSGNRRLYGSFYLGTKENRTYHFVFDADDRREHPVFYLDANQNLDLTDDGPPLRSQGSGIFSAFLTLPFGRLIKEYDSTERFKIWLFVNKSSWPEGPVRYYSAIQMRGSVTIDGKSFLAYIAERGFNDADFTNDGVFLDLNGNRTIESEEEYIDPGRIFQLGDKQYVLNVTW